MNYGEQLTYWYLRLNGFFPIADFVHHRAEQTRWATDTDLLAVRLAHWEEEIGNTPVRPDCALEQMLLPCRNKRHVGLIVQVKTGQDACPGHAFDRDRLLVAVKRMGMLSSADLLDSAVRTLEQEARWESNEWVIAKLFVSRYNGPDGCYLKRTLPEINGWIMSRLNSYVDVKDANRLFFPDELMQYLAWQEADGQGQEKCRHGK